MARPLTSTRLIAEDQYRAVYASLGGEALLPPATGLVSLRIMIYQQLAGRKISAEIAREDLATRRSLHIMGAINPKALTQETVDEFQHWTWAWVNKLIPGAIRPSTNRSNDLKAAQEELEQLIASYGESGVEIGSAS